MEAGSFLSSTKRVRSTSACTILLEIDKTMSPSRTDRVISNVFGTLGAVCWSVQLTPQIVLNYRRHSADGLSSAFMLLWACAGVPLGVYNIVADFNIALQVQPQILTLLSLVTWLQCCYYQRHWTAKKAGTVAGAIAIVMGGVETGLVLAVRAGQERGIEWPTKLMAALAALFLSLGVLEQYLAIWKNRSVEGISFLFCGIDALGDITSIVSVCFEPSLSILALVMYGVELLLWTGIFACGAYFKIVPWTKRKVVTRRQQVDRQATSSDSPHGIRLHQLSSSTSVFRVASSSSGTRSRPQPIQTPEDTP